MLFRDIMLDIVFFSTGQHTKFEVPSFIDYKDMTAAPKFKMSHVT